MTTPNVIDIPINKDTFHSNMSANSTDERVLYDMIFASSPDALLIIAKDATVYNGNAAFFKLSNLSREQVIGKDLEQVTVKFTKDQVLKRGLLLAFRNVFAVETSILVEPHISEHQSRDYIDDEKWYKQTLSPLKINGVVEYVLYKAEIEDLSRTPIRMKAHEIENLQFQRLVASVKEYAIFTIDASGIIITWNIGAQQMKQYTTQEIIGKHISIFYPEEYMANKLPEKILLAALKNGSCEQEDWRVKKDGSRFWANVTTTPVFGAKGELVGYVKITKDLTEQKLLEANKIKYIQESAENLLREQLALKDVELKNRFLSNVSHELRTPLHGIGSYIDFLSATKLTDLQTEYVESISKSVEYLKIIVNDLTDISKLEKGQIKLKSHVFSPLQVLQNTLCLMKTVATEKCLVISLDVSNSLSTYVTGDRDRFQQIVVNILSNAVKFTSKGTIKIYAWCEANCEPKHTCKVFVRVTDTGIGMTPDTVSSLGTPFSQVDSSITRSIGGLGIGFRISLQLARLMGGDIEVKSELGRGTTVTIFVLMSNPVSHGKTIEKTAQSDSFQMPHPLSRYKILVFEDNLVNQAVVKKALSTAGAEVCVASNGQLGLEEWRFRPNYYDLLLLDCHMPIMDGFEATRILRNEGCTVPIIALTADVLQESRKKCFESGMNDCINKPFKPAELIKLILSCMENRKAAC